MKKISIRAAILIPVIWLGVLATLSNIVSMINIRRVNSNALVVTEKYMVAINELQEVRYETQEIHKAALSHIVAVDLDTMLAMIDTIRAEQKQLEEKLVTVKQYVSADLMKEYDNLVAEYGSFIYSVEDLLAYSAAGDNDAAFACANNRVKVYGVAMQTAIDLIIADAEKGAAAAELQFKSTYVAANIMVLVTIILIVGAGVLAIVIVSRKVIRPLHATEKQLSIIIDDIDRREGDLTKRIDVINNDEIGHLASGINVFIGKLQDIFGMLKNNTAEMDQVVEEVLGNVMHASDSLATLSAMTEELTATMDTMSNGATAVGENTDSVLIQVNEIAEKTIEIDGLTKQLKADADIFVNDARSNMEESGKKVNEMLQVLDQAIKESASVDQVNSLTQNILSIANQTNLLSLNASIEAARAGEAGRGFAVVASEISNLSKATSDTASHIREINEIVTSAVKNLSTHSQELVRYLSESIMPEFEKMVASGAENRDNADRIEGIMTEFARKTDSLKTEMNQIADSMSSIVGSIGECEKGVENAANSTEALVLEMSNVSDKMDANKSIADALNRETEIFTKL